MFTVVSLTKQGQISIPAKMRKSLGWTTESKVLVSHEGNGLRIEMPVDITSLAGVFHYAAKTKMTRAQVIEAEEKAWQKAVVEKSKKFLG
jgi:AbrB family looped-hinge helix DNA binding protein